MRILLLPLLFELDSLSDIKGVRAEQTVDLFFKLRDVCLVESVG